MSSFANDGVVNGIGVSSYTSCDECAKSCHISDTDTGSIALTESELELLGEFARIPFWPLAGHYDSNIPFCFENELMAQPDLLSSLAVKGLISLDFNIPLKNFDYSASYSDYPQHGSMALTYLGQRVIEIADTSGVEES